MGLAFSGGKDSWACLWLNKDRLKDIVVIWINSGKNYPEMLETIELAKSICPNFIELIVDRDGQNEFHGLPSDVVPINWTRTGQDVTCKKSVQIQSYLNCCYENIAVPLNSFCKKNGITHLITGQRNDEGHKASSRNFDVIEGITRLHPIEEWTAKQVINFVAQHMELPSHFLFNHSSMDCYDCTAYATESKDRIDYMRTVHPKLYAEYSHRNNELKAALLESLKDII